MILVSEKGCVREVSTDPLDAKMRAAREDFRKDMEDTLGWGRRRPPAGRKVVLVPEGTLHREPRPKMCVSRGINEQILAGAK